MSIVRSSEASTSISSTVVSIRTLVLDRFSEVVRFSEGPLREALLYIACLGQSEFS